MFKNHKGEKCGCPHHMWGAIFLIILGALLLLAILGVITTNVMLIILAILLILLGVTKLFKCKCC